MDDRTVRGLVSIILAVAMLAVGAMAGRIFPADTAYVMPLFVFSAAIFLADGAVTFTRMQRNQAELDRERDRASAPWRAAFAVGFLLALVAAARTGSSFVTTTAVVLAVVAAGIYLYRRRFFAILNEAARGSATGGSRIRQALNARDHDGVAAALEERIDQENDPARRGDLLLALGAVHVFRGAYDEAVRAFERIDRSRRESGIDMAMVVDLNVASAYVAKGDFESAESAMSRIDAATLAPEFRTAYDMNQSAILVGKGAHEESIRFVEALGLDAMPERSRVPFLRDLAESLAASGTDTGRALEIATRCVEIDGGAQSHNLVAFVLIAQKKFSEALTRLDSALALNPDGRSNLRVFAETWLYYGLAQRGQGDAAAARSSFEKASKLKGGGRFSLAALREVQAEAAPA